ncbi:MFS transporter [Saccharothrix stipae]
MTVIAAPPRNAVVPVAFTAYGALWGPYLAALPEVRAATGATTGQLGLALLVGAVAALPAMAWVGRLLDRFGRVVVASVLVLFAVTAVLPTTAGSVPGLVVSIALFGFGSGACNVVVVALASAEEARTGARVMNRAHALFSVGVLVFSALTGLVATAGVPARAVSVVLAIGLVGWVWAVRDSFPEHVGRHERRARRERTPGARRPRVRPVPLLVLLAGLAMLVESGVQQWSAVFLSDVLDAAPPWSAAAPGVFAGMMAAGRLGGHWLSVRAADRTLLQAAGLVSGVGVLLIATAAEPLIALAGTALVGAAISVATPITYGLAGRGAPPGESGALIGATASLANLGLLLGPALVGQIADRSDLRTAMVVLAPVCLVVCLLGRRTATVPVLAEERKSP